MAAADRAALPGLATATSRRAVLYAVAVVLAVAEAVALFVIGFRSALSLAPQVAAPPPFGAYHDLRWVFTFSSSWFSFAWQLAAVVVFRTVVNTVFAALAWPDDVERPNRWRLLRRSAFATLITLAAVSPWATLAFASSAVSFSWFMLGSIIAVAATAVVLPSALVEGSWWRRLVPWRAMLFTLAVWLGLMVEALAISYAPSWVAIVAAAGSGALNALFWQHQITTIVHAPEPKHFLPGAPVGVVGILALFLVGGGSLLGSTNGTSSSKQPVDAAKAPAGTPMLYVPGYGSSYNGSSFRMFGRPTWHFSYAGLSAAGTPEPYRQPRTHQSLVTSARTLAAQVSALHQKSGKPIVLLADSEGTVVVRAYLDRAANPPVRMFIEMSPLVRPGRVYFPGASATGYGYAAGWEARGLLDLLSTENAGFAKNADQPFVRSVVTHAGTLRAGIICPAGHVPVYAFVPFEGALTVYDQPISRVPWTAIPGYHATLLSNTTVQRDVVQLLRTGKMPSHDKTTAAFRVISAAASAWQVPALPLDLRSAWHGQDRFDAAFADWTCPSPQRFAPVVATNG